MRVAPSMELEVFDGRRKATLPMRALLNAVPGSFLLVAPPAIALLFWLLPFNRQNADALTIMFGCIAALLLMMIANLCDARPRPIHLLTCIYLIFYFLLPGYFHVAYGQYPFFQAGYSPAQVLNAAIVVAVFICCFFLGYSVQIAIGDCARRAVPHRLMLATLLCGVTALVCAAAVGFGTFLQTIREANALQAAGSVSPTPFKLVFGALARSSSFFGFLFGVFLYRIEKSAGNLFAALFGAGVFFLLNSPLAVTRFILGSYIISTFLVLTKFSRVQKFIIAAALISAQAGLFSYISYLSRGDLSASFTWSPLEEFTKSGDFDGFQSTINVVAMHDELGGKGGVNIASALFFFVPRPLWPEKSGGTGGEAALFFGYPMYNISSPLPSEFYIDFGIPGVIVFSLLFGLLIRMGDDRFAFYKERSDYLGQIMMATVASYIFIILRGSLVGTLGPFMVSIALAFVCHRLVCVPAPAATFSGVAARDG
ncbi:hypothetical protein [Methylocella sp.]|uniref:hypothetical protein n=1 Tax=Methylocella sp. TaxID=1978226 RepID=UPI0037847634